MEIYRGENLILEYDEDGRPPKLFLGSEGEQWYFLELEGARALRNALNEGIKLMEAGASEDNN